MKEQNKTLDGSGLGGSKPTPPDKNFDFQSPDVWGSSSTSGWVTPPPYPNRSNAG